MKATVTPLSALRVELEHKGKQHIVEMFIEPQHCKEGNELCIVGHVTRREYSESGDAENGPSLEVYEHELGRCVTALPADHLLLVSFSTKELTSAAIRIIENLELLAPEEEEEDDPYEFDQVHGKNRNL